MYKVGDRVRIKPWSWYCAHRNDAGRIYKAGAQYYFNARRSAHCGREATVVEVFSVCGCTSYHLSWPANMLAREGWMFEPCIENIKEAV
jgi:hypothetical protein